MRIAQMIVARVERVAFRPVDAASAHHPGGRRIREQRDLSRAGR